MKEKVTNKKFFDFFLYVMFAVFLIITISQKGSLMMDEVYSYGLANHKYADTVKMKPVEGKTYSPAGEAYLEYVTVSEDGRFDYSNVWKNQTEDTHPPLYYVLLHTICSCFPNTFNIWYAGSINIVFALLTLWGIRKLVGELTKDRKFKTVVSICYIVTPGVLNISAYFRMYIMAMFWVTLITYLFVRAIKHGGDKKTYVQVCIVSVLGALTHYYFLVYLLFLCVVMGVYLLYSRLWKETIIFCMDMLVAGGITVGIFPAILTHLFGMKSHSKSTINNLLFDSVYEYVMRIFSFYSSMNKYLFGNALMLIIILALFCIGILFIRYYKANGMKWKQIRCFMKKNKIEYFSWLLLIVPCFFYFVLVSRIATYVASRYMHPIYAVVFVLGISILWNIIERIVKSDYQKPLFYVLMLMMVIQGWSVSTWGFLYLDGKESLKIAEQYSDKECIYIYTKDKGMMLHASFYEIASFEQVTFVTKENMDLLENLSAKEQEELVVYITSDCDSELILQEIKDRYPLLEEYEKITEYGNAEAYYFY